jgi:hypothetical protein
MKLSGLLKRLVAVNGLGYEAPAVWTSCGIMRAAI